MHDVLVVYKQISMQFNEDGMSKPFEGTPVHTLSYDEKPGIQATDSTVRSSAYPKHGQLQYNMS